MSKRPLTPAQCRTARGLIGWNQGDLARAAGVSRQTINDFESGKREPIPNNMFGILMAFLEAGVMPLEEEPETRTSNGGGRGVRFTRREGESPDPMTAVQMKAIREAGREVLKGR
jgi:transcriptional regulator with XRE-family HTH domain